MKCVWRISSRALFFLCIATLAVPALALAPNEVLVLYNAASPDGAAIAGTYQALHPGARTLAIQNVTSAEETTYDVYLDVIRPQVLSALDNSTNCIVTTLGLPLRINNPNPGGYTYWSQYSSLESELTRVDTFSTREQLGLQRYNRPPPSGNPQAQNPYFTSTLPFSYGAFGIRLTSRLDGYNRSDVLAMLNRAQRCYYGQLNSVLVDDDQNAPASTVDRMSQLVDNVLGPAGINYTYDATDAVITAAPGKILGYVSHGVHGGAAPDYITNGLSISPADGAVFHTWESFNAVSFRQGANRGQGLLADWVHIGGTAGTGHVEEPGASASNVTNEDRLFQGLLNGMSWAEAAWSATQQLSYVNTFVGDPLMRWELVMPGDANGDGVVDVMDLGIVATNYDGSSAQWEQGDFTRDSRVNVDDLGIVTTNYQDSDTSPTTLPEPSLLVMLLSGLGLRLRRK